MTDRRTLAAVALLAAAPAWAADPVEFNRDIRPILSDNCFHCHGPDKSHRKAKLRLDVREAAVEHGALAPGKSAESDVVARVFATDETEVMPPPESNKKLTAKQKELLKRWVAEGAVYQPHWAYIVPTRPAVPAVKNTSWVRNPVDAFILAELEKRNLAPSPEADRRALIRRVSLDLTGLPPTPEDVEAFVADQSPAAYEKLVDRLLASPHYGERMTVPWLDLVRYADTVGFHGDQNQNVFPYRDYVVDSFNANKRFDVFTREQLAGDLLPDPTPEQLTATCFNRLNMMTREGGAQAKEYLAKYQADRVRATAMTWLGSTLGCAECHDHKFDPFTQKDFYALGAFFADVKQWGLYNYYKYAFNPELKGSTNDHPFPPELAVDSPYLVRRLAKLRDRLRVAGLAAVGADDTSRAAFRTFEAAGRKFLADHPDGWTVPPVAPEAQDAEVEADGRVVFTGKVAKGGTRVVTLRPTPGRIASVRLELFPHASHKGFLARDGSESVEIASVSVAVKSKDKNAVPARLGFGQADGQKVRYSGSAPVLGLANGAWTTSPDRPKAATAAAWLLDDPVTVADGDELIVTLKTDDIGCARVSVSPLAGANPLRSAADLDWPTAHLLATGDDAAQAIVREIAECRGGKHPVQVTVALEKPMTMRVLPRGNWMDETGPVVQPAVPGFLSRPPTDGRRLTRLDLADWLTSQDNPLTARVFVNRLWKQFFGTGLSGVLEDVGAQGEAPSHPELLDWLAVEFRDGWDVKKAVKTLVMSAAYRQDSKGRPELRDLDPGNRLVAFQTPRRLEAEFVRDNALSIAGLLNREMGGPSVKPYQPAGYYANLQFPERDYAPHRDERQYRRGVYTHWQRTFLHPMLANFDASGREECSANRIPANSPQQALTLLNDPTFVEAARVLAGDLLAGEGGDVERVDRLYRKALARPAKPTEQTALGRLLRDQRSYYAQRPDDAEKLSRVGLAPVGKGVPLPELAAWTQVCRTVLNLHETITRY